MHTLQYPQTNFLAALARRPEARIVAVDMEASHLEYIKCVALCVVYYTYIIYWRGGGFVA